MHREKILYVTFGTIPVSGFHWGSCTVSPVDKGRPLYTEKLKLSAKLRCRKIICNRYLKLTANTTLMYNKTSPEMEQFAVKMSEMDYMQEEYLGGIF